MLYLYNILITITFSALKIVALFNRKIDLFVKGRKHSFKNIAENISETDAVFWVHVASLGEYEQGLPLMEALKKEYPSHKIVLTFFSPSGYEVKKDNTIADVTIYLPMDTKANAKKFIKMVHPEKAFFVKYEYWPNYLYFLKKHKIDTFLISGIFRDDQIFFKNYGNFYRNALKSFTYFFVQNTISKDLLATIDFTNVAVVGDTRFDRVSQIIDRDNQLLFLDDLTHNKTKQTIVIGSSWPQDDKLLVDYINNTTDENLKFVIAPHNIKTDEVNNLYNSITKSKILHSEWQKDPKSLSSTQVYVIDAYSLLTKAYSYATIAYVGGGFGSGIHNVLEAATFGIPVLIGPNYKKFQEAKDLVALKSCLVINNYIDLNNTLNLLINNQETRKEKGYVNQQFVLKNKNATQIIMNYLKG